MLITNKTWQSALPALAVKADDTALAVLKLRTPAISDLNRMEGSTEIGITVFETTILGILDFFDVDWTPSQIRDCAELMHGEYYWLHLAELKHFAMQCKKGEFGKSFGKLTPATLTGWMDDYASTSLRQRGEMRIEDADKVEAPEPEGTIDVSERLKEFVSGWQQELVAQREADEAEMRRLRQEQAEKMQQRIREYAEREGVTVEELQRHVEPDADAPRQPLEITWMDSNGVPDDFAPF